MIIINCLWIISLDSLFFFSFFLISSQFPSANYAKLGLNSIQANFGDLMMSKSWFNWFFFFLSLFSYFLLLHSRNHQIICWKISFILFRNYGNESTLLWLFFSSFFHGFIRIGKWKNIECLGVWGMKSDRESEKEKHVLWISVNWLYLGIN